MGEDHLSLLALLGLSHKGPMLVCFFILYWCLIWICFLVGYYFIYLFIQNFMSKVRSPVVDDTSCTITGVGGGKAKDTIL